MSVIQHTAGASAATVSSTFLYRTAQLSQNCRISKFPIINQLPNTVLLKLCLTMATPRAPKQWQLTKDETINSFENWKQNSVYILSLDNNLHHFWQRGSPGKRRQQLTPIEVSLMMTITSLKAVEKLQPKRMPNLNLSSAR